LEFGLGSKAIGTYVKVIQFQYPPPPFREDAQVVLYLLPSGLYLFLGYWSGHELTAAAGRWIEREDRVLLRGVGATLMIDFGPFSSAPRVHDREFLLKIDHRTPMLVAETEHEGWSLLSWRGTLTYLGSFHHFDLKDERLPRSWEQIEPWVKEFLATRKTVME
jgi:hypothetical protein